jgi:hypothetical protein
VIEPVSDQDAAVRCTGNRRDVAELFRSTLHRPDAKILRDVPPFAVIPHARSGIPHVDRSIRERVHAATPAIDNTRIATRAATDQSERGENSETVGDAGAR